MYRDFITNNKTLTAILLFLTIYILIIIGKPKFLYHPNGSLREFGVGFRNKTIFPIWLLAIILAILCYLFILYYSVHPRLFSY